MCTWDNQLQTPPFRARLVRRDDEWNKKKDKSQLFEWTNVFYGAKQSFWSVFPTIIVNVKNLKNPPCSWISSFLKNTNFSSRWMYPENSAQYFESYMFFVVWKQTLILYWVTSSKWIKHPFGSKFYCLQKLTPFPWTDVEFVTRVTILLCHFV